MAVTANQKTISNTRPTIFGYHGLYCGARTLLVSQASGYPYQEAPTSPTGVEGIRPVSSVMAIPQTAATATICRFFMF